MIIPMIDIIFFLLVFFMLSTIYMVSVKSVPVALPDAQTAQTELQEPILITLTENGAVYVEQKEVGLANLIQEVQTVQQVKPEAVIILEADKNTRYEKVVEILDTLRQNGITEFGLSAESAR